MARLPPRLEFRQPRTVMPWLRACGRAHTTHAVPAGLEGHAHHGAWELCWVERGRLDWWVGAEACRLSAGEVMITRPDEQHGARTAVLEPGVLWWIQFEDPHPDQPPALRRLLAVLARAPRRFAGVRALAEPWLELLLELARPDGWSSEAVLGHAEVLCARLGRSAQVPSARIAPSPDIARCLAWAEERKAWNIPVAALAHQAGLSPARLHVRFREELGATPGEWQRARRHAEACRLLATGGLTIAAIARRLGFASSQQFAHVFRRAAGTTPSAYRAATR
jgi:AraC-like DNA-binding protein/mannose-6-phosphate isomerase-like protein (cupin superfamily)